MKEYIECLLYTMANNLKKDKQSDSEFICKLQDMMEKYPTILSWNQDGTQLAVNDIKSLQQNVLPSYFRHRNFGSFVRQLNMYNFHKVCRQNNSYNFKNQIFMKGNQPNFHQIKRKKKNKDQENYLNNFQEEFEEILKSINEDNRLTSSVKLLMRNLIQFKYIAVQNQRKIKRYLDTICKQLKDSRSKKITNIVLNIKQNSLEKLQYNLNISKTIDKYIHDHLLKDLKNQKLPSNNSLVLLDQHNTMKDIMGSAIVCNYPSSFNSLVNFKSDLHNLHNQQNQQMSCSQVSFQDGVNQQ